jgi:hypothetical protein
MDKEREIKMKKRLSIKKQKMGISAEVYGEYNRPGDF